MVKRRGSVASPVASWSSDDRFDTSGACRLGSRRTPPTGDVGPIGALAVDDGFASYAPAGRGARIRRSPRARALATRRGRSACRWTGDVARGRARREPNSRAVASAPYAEVVGEMLRESDNNTAELLLKELAPRRAAVRPATRAAGVSRRVRPRCKQLGVAHRRGQGDRRIRPRSQRPGDVHGAARHADHQARRVRPRRHARRRRARPARSTTASLDSPLAGRLRAKTGSLDDVTALVGRHRPDAARVRCASRSSRTALHRRRRQGAAGPARRARWPPTPRRPGRRYRPMSEPSSCRCRCSRSAPSRFPARSCRCTSSSRATAR